MFFAVWMGSEIVCTLSSCALLVHNPWNGPFRVHGLVMDILILWSTLHPAWPIPHRAFCSTKRKSVGLNSFVDVPTMVIPLAGTTSPAAPVVEEGCSLLQNCTKLWHIALSTGPTHWGNVSPVEIHQDYGSRE